MSPKDAAAELENVERALAMSREERRRAGIRYTRRQLEAFGEQLRELADFETNPPSVL